MFFLTGKRQVPLLNSGQTTHINKFTQSGKSSTSSKQKKVTFLLWILLTIAVIFPVFLPACGSSDPDAAPDDLIIDELANELSNVLAPVAGTPDTTEVSPQGITADSGEKMKAVWITYAELSVKNPSVTAAEYSSKLSAMLDNIAAAGNNAVFFHVRPFADAVYKSNIFPWSTFLSGTQGVAPQYDALEIAVAEAHKRGLELHAWINPYRVSNSPDVTALSSDNPARVYYESGKSQNLIICEAGIYFNPASEESQALIVGGVREILEGYDVDGIHFDDYFYPATDASIDSASYTAYTSGGGTLTLDDWRRSCVNSMLAEVCAEARAHGKVFGISPAADIEKNISTLYADINSWSSSDQYIDYICPQIYFGFEHQKLPFEATLERWKKLFANSGIELYIGLAAYKVGAEDVYAGAESAQLDTPRYEWINHADVLPREIGICESDPAVNGYVLFSYGYLF